jgi:hypothetical protein
MITNEKCHIKKKKCTGENNRNSIRHNQLENKKKSGDEEFLVI